MQYAKNRITKTTCRMPAETFKVFIVASSPVSNPNRHSMNLYIVYPSMSRCIKNRGVVLQYGDLAIVRKPLLELVESLEVERLGDDVAS